MFSNSNRPYPAQSDQDEEVEEDYSWVQPRHLTRARPAPTRPQPARRPVRPDAERDTEGRPPCVNCSRDASRDRYRITAPLQTIVAKRADMQSPVWPTFARNFAACAPGCQPLGTNVHRPHNGRMSCHHVDRAIDVFGMSCGGRRSMSGSPAFGQMVACMRGKMPTIYQQAYKLQRIRARGGRITAGDLTDAHYDHAHFSIGCYGGFH